MISPDEEFPAEKVLAVILYKVLHRQQFSICDTVIPLCFVECMTSVSYDSFIVALDLREDGSHRVVRCISVENEKAFARWIRHYFGTAQSPL